MTLSVTFKVTVTSKLRNLLQLVTLCVEAVASIALVLCMGVSLDHSDYVLDGHLNPPTDRGLSDVFSRWLQYVL